MLKYLEISKCYELDTQDPFILSYVLDVLLYFSIINR